MIRGGYKIIDLKNKELISGVGMLYEGIYDAIEECQKPILISGINFGGNLCPDRWVDFTIDGSSYATAFLDASGNECTMTVTDTDVVTIIIN